MSCFSVVPYRGFCSDKVAVIHEPSGSRWGIFDVEREAQCFIGALDGSGVDFGRFASCDAVFEDSEALAVLRSAKRWHS